MNEMKLNHWQIIKARHEFTDSKSELIRWIHTLEKRNDWIPCNSVAQVHQILMKNGFASEKVLENGDSSEFKEVSAYDWIYRTEFKTTETEPHTFLLCKGLDTVCDIFLNGEHLGTSESMYIPFEKEITHQLHHEGCNQLILYFHGHEKMLHYFADHMPAEYKGHVPEDAMLLKSHDYGADPENNRGYRNIGIFDDVLITSVSALKLENTDIDVTLGQPFYNFNKATVKTVFSGISFYSGNLKVSIHITEADGSNDITAIAEQFIVEGEFEIHCSITVPNPKLWWPKNYGAPPLYKLTARFSLNGEDAGTVQKPFGIRDLRKTGNMRFECNGTHIRLFGGDVAPIYGPSNVFHDETAFDLIDKIDFSGMTSIRIWGPSKPYPDRFYDKLDELGILVWQDFPTGGSELPCDEKYSFLIVQQAKLMVKRLKHHPCIYLWCGGNENVYMNAYTESTSTIGYHLLTHSFRQICESLDPSREYHVSCPYEGTYPNDPDYGDSHGSRAFRRYCPGEPYGAFFSENIRVYPPQYKTMKRWLGEENIWNNDYVDIKPAGCKKNMPPSWAKLLGNYGEEKVGPIQEYYSAQTPQDMIYKYTAAACQDIYDLYARARRGNPHYKSQENVFCQGFMLWKINDPWPAFYCSMIDYYGECAMSYYTVKRAVSPIWIDLEVADRIYLWGVNDTSEHFSGSIDLIAFRMDENQIVSQTTIPVSIHRDSAGIIMNLDLFGPLHWFTVLYARLKNEKGESVFTTRAFLTKENMLPFPDSKITISLEEDVLTVKTDCFARCVELFAENNFGWMFEDNFFDLFPFEEKKIRIIKRGKGKNICAKAHYGTNTAMCSLDSGKGNKER